MTRKKSYTKEQLIDLYKKVENENGVITSTKLAQYNLPSINVYNSMFGSWNRFLIAAGNQVKVRPYRKKTDPKRYLTHEEYTHICSTLKKKKYLIQFLILCHTGMNISEARKIDIDNIDFTNKTIKILGKDKVYNMDDTLFKYLSEYISENPLQSPNPFGYPTTYGYNKRLKKLIKKSGINDYEDYSIRTLQNTYLKWKEDDDNKG